LAVRFGSERPSAGEVGVDCGDDHGSLADSRCHPLDGVRAHVTDGEQPGYRGGEAVVGEHEALGVEVDTDVVQPGRAGVRADHQEQCGRVESYVPVAGAVVPGQPAEPAAAMDGGQFAARVHGDPLVVGQALDQVVRHGVAQFIAADQDVDVAGVAREELGRLSGGVGAPDHDGVAPGDQVGLQLACGVVHATALQVGQAGQVQAPVPHAAGDDHRCREDVVFVVEPHPKPA